MSKKKIIPGLMPIKKWLSLSEACSYMDMSANTLKGIIAAKGLTVSVMGNKIYYKVSELEGLIESNVIIKKAS